jgi:AraC-like DNA-binding protein
MRIEHHPADPRLGGAVAGYQTRTADLTGREVKVPLPARTEVILEFYFTAPHLVEFQKTGERDRAPWTVAVGMQTFRRVDLVLSGRLDVFTVRLRPTGLHQLFGMPMTHFTDAAVEAEHLFGPGEADRLHMRLEAAGSLAARAAIMDAALLQHLKPRAPSLLAAAAHRLRASHGAASLRDLERESGLSARQFRRAFKAEVGASPKLYGRIVRLNAAVDAKLAAPSTSWTEIAHQFGWFDQAHLDKDFAALAGASPTDFVRRRSAA